MEIGGGGACNLNREMSGGLFDLNPEIKAGGGAI